MTRKIKIPFLLFAIFSSLSFFSWADESLSLSKPEKQVDNVFNYCSGSTLKEDRAGLIKAGFVNIKNGSFNGELPSDYKSFVDKFYKDSGVGDFYLKNSQDGFSLIIIDSENTCNSIPVYGDTKTILSIIEKRSKDKVNENESVGKNGEKIKSAIYKIKDKIFVLSKIDIDQKNDYKMITAVRVYY